MNQLVQAKEYLGYKDLYAMGIVSSRTELSRLQRTAGFPMPIKFSRARSAKARWPRHEVISWMFVQKMHRLVPEPPPFADEDEFNAVLQQWLAANKDRMQ